MARTSMFRLALGAALLLGAPGCLMFPAPTPPVPLGKAEVGAIAKCQKGVKKAQRALVKTTVASLGACVDGVLAARLAFENGLTTQEEFDAGLVKLRGKCAKNYAKVGAATTKLVDAVLKACAPADAAIADAYDALRFQAAFGDFTSPATGLAEFAAEFCTATVETAQLQVWQAAPRLLELLGYLGVEYLVVFDESEGLPNVPLDPRCLPLQGPV
ncbi:MAG: hypothetical protein IT293_13955 [Deltaproteobacteria bacterium]|nr:hypothetical protein [Deltaproteobacteria bacterium]